MEVGLPHLYVFTGISLCFIQHSRSCHEKKREQELQQVVVTAAAVAATSDGRAFRLPVSRLFSAPISPWPVMSFNRLYEGWYMRHLKCSVATFSVLLSRIEARWCDVHDSPGKNAQFDVATKVAVTLCYLTSEGSYHTAGSIFGGSRSRTIYFVDEVERPKECLPIIVLYAKSVNVL